MKTSSAPATQPAATRVYSTIDGNEAAASVAHRSAEVIAIYPITPASNMGEYSDEWSAKGQKNLWGQVPNVIEMQSEAGAAGTVHGALQAGSLATTFTAAQGLLLMIPNMYKIAGELSPCVLHVAARTIATHALSIFGDHSDVMACRQTGWAMLCAGSVQETHDMAAIAHAATLRARVPFIHFFDGFRTSHEVARVEMIDDATLLAMYDEDAISQLRKRALTPDAPVIRGTAQNPDTFFQAREACNSFYDATPGIVADAMARFAELTGRRYKPFDYVGHPEAERVIVMMGSGADTAHEAVDWLVARGEKVGLVKVHLYRPFDARMLIAALPKTVRSVAVLDRTKEPGAIAEPLHLDVVTALSETTADGLAPFAMPRVVGGRFGLSSKEFTPAMVKAVYDELAGARPANHFTIGIEDDVTHLSLRYDTALDIEPADVTRAVFVGLGSDGTVSSNKQTVKIISEETPLYGQGYFVYDSKKSGAMTVSHLRFSPRPIQSAYLVRTAGFVACHQPQFIDKVPVLDFAAPGATFLFNTPEPADKVWDTLPAEVQATIIEKKLRMFVIDAYKVAELVGLGRRISTVMQTCFFALSGVLPQKEAIAKIKYAAQKAYGKRGEEVVRRNHEAIDNTIAQLHEVKLPGVMTAKHNRLPIVTENAPDFVKRVSGLMLEGRGELLPVSAFPVDGTWPVGSSRYEKRSIALEIPVWDPKICIQCNKCSMVCPHACIRTIAYEPAELAGAPSSFLAMDYKSSEIPGWKYTVQVSPDDCTGCGLCVAVCPAKDKANPKHKSIDMKPMRDAAAVERENWAHFEKLHWPDRRKLATDLKGSQLLQPLFEYSGACAGCGETPYVKLLTQLFGDRALIANATGCSSIYGGNLPTTPYCANADGRGPAWANSLFEDNAEFGLGFRLAIDSLGEQAVALVRQLGGRIGDELVRGLLDAQQEDEAGIAAQRERVVALRDRLRSMDTFESRRLALVADYLVKKSVWIVGGDGWAYDIGYGGLDHVLAGNADVNLLVLDTEVYSNTGGQQSKATPTGAAAKFAAAGKEGQKKDLGLLAMTYGHVYVASVAFGAKDIHTLRAFQEAASWKGPSLIIAYSHCIAHGYDMVYGLDQQKKAVESGVWPLYRFDPRRIEKGEPPLSFDSGPIKTKARDYMKGEARFRMVELADPKRYERLVDSAERQALSRRALYEQVANIRFSAETQASPAPTKE